MELKEATVLHLPEHEVRQINGVVALLAPAAPNWLGTDGRGAAILEQFDGRRSFGEVVRDYAAEHKLEEAKARQHVETIARDALRQKLLFTEIVAEKPYPGRRKLMPRRTLDELWLHTNNSCNLACSHCLVSSGPDGDPGLETERLLDIIDQARGLGTKRFYFTGGEPLVRKDFFELVDAVLADPEAELAVLTNGVLLRDQRLEELAKRDSQRLRLQVSLDGSSEELNDPIRGAGSFPRIREGIRRAIAAGLSVTVTTAITLTNAEDVPEITRLVAELGGTSHHLLWLHKRGRADGSGPDFTPAVEQVIEVVRRAQAVGREVGVVIDNAAAIKARLAAPAGVKRDLSNACASSLCVYSDGKVYPSAATADVSELCCGDLAHDDLASIFETSPVVQSFVDASVEDKEICRDCSLKFLCGGGDVEHSYFYGGSIAAHDPYCELHKAMFADAMGELIRERKAVTEGNRSGFDAPVAFAGMGETTTHCASGEDPGEVITSHSECVVSFDLDAPRKLVREFYGAAAEEPQEELCCPVQPAAEDLSHIPAEVVERFYGCGSPVQAAEIQPGEVTLDLGSGAGIDVFIAARNVGAEGRALGVDMTDAMLAVAHEAKPKVAASLGYDVVEFRKGFLEEIPVEAATVDLVTSNCVINLSPDKKRVFSEMWRVLRDHGRIVISDIVAEQEVPAHQRRDPRLWGECISGSLTEEELLAFLERAGFYGVGVLSRTFWKEVEGHRFHSVTVRGYKFEKTQGCVFRGQHLVYQGHFKGVTDEEGHFFPRGVPIEVCTDTAAKLSRSPYAGQFLMLDPEDPGATDFLCSTDGSCC